MCLLPFSCSLEEETRTEVEKKNYMNNAEEAKDVLLGVYRTNTLDAMYGYYLSILFNLGTDISQVEGSGNENFRIIPTNSFPTTQSEDSKHGQHFIPVFTEQMIFWTYLK